MKLVFEDAYNKFYLEFYGKYTQIIGESATGKTYLCDAMHKACNRYIVKPELYPYSLNDGKVFFINSKSDVLLVDQAKDTLDSVVVIDRADFMLCTSPELVRLLQDTIKRRYVLIGRGRYDQYGIGISYADTFVLKHKEIDTGLLFYLAKEDA